MSTTSMINPFSRVRFGLARVDITPPVGIYHRLWGAARHDRASGVHRPLFGEVMVFSPLDGHAPPIVRLQLDLCGLVQSQHDELASTVAVAASVSRERVIIGYSHTHSSGWFVPDRIPLPGGELIPGYLEGLGRLLADTTRRALTRRIPATITYGVGRCSMAANRDYWDSDLSGYTCGFNPDSPADDTVLVGRVTGADGRSIATLVHYACHPTTLAWESSLISPDFVGAMRETVEAATNVPCIYLQGACGDLGPRHGFVGDPAIADRNGRQLAYAALAALEGLGPTTVSFRYSGPVVSGATLGVWAYQPAASERMARAERFDGLACTVDLPLKDRPDPAELQTELETWEARRQAADERGDTAAARDASARAERARRWLARLKDIGTGATYPLRCTITRLGEAIWVTCGGEPYNLFQTELRRRFGDQAIIVSPLDGDLQVAYLLPADRYGRGLYQEEPSSLAAGCLERLIDEIAARIAIID